MNSGKNLQYDFRKMRGGIKGRLELFRKFIRFGGAGLPLLKQRTSHKRHVLGLPFMLQCAIAASMWQYVLNVLFNLYEHLQNLHLCNMICGVSCNAM